MGTIKTYCKNCKELVSEVRTQGSDDRVAEGYCKDCGPKGKRIVKYGDDGKPYYAIEKSK